MKIAILTMFNGLSETYSLVNVVGEQLKMLLSDEEMQISLLVSEHCPDSERHGIYKDPRIEWLKIINSHEGKQFNWVTYTRAEDKIASSFYIEADLISKDFVMYLKDVDICIMHDILYQGVHLVHNVAIRKAQKELPNVNFLAFTHSAPAKAPSAPYPISCMFSPMPHTTIVYPTECGLLAICQQYNTTLDKCVSVNNSMDILLGMTAQVQQLSKLIDFSQREILIVYPARLTMGKKFHLVAEFAGYIKKYCHKTLAVIFCDFPSADIPSALYKFMIRDLGTKQGLTNEDIYFTSDCGFKDGVMRKTVLDLFSLSNLFICPSYSESFGLMVIEAASKGNYIVLNEAVPALAEIGNTIGAHFMRWDARNFDRDTHETYHPSERLYFIEHAQAVMAHMDKNSVIQAKTLVRTRYSNDWIYKNQLKPLLIATHSEKAPIY